MTIPKRVKKRWQGHNVNRYQREPLEHRFAKYWQRENDRSHPTLGYLLGDGNNCVPTSDRDELVANTVIQWLGSHVGQCFLNSVLCNTCTEDLDHGIKSLLKRNNR